MISNLGLASSIAISTFGISYAASHVRADSYRHAQLTENALP
jgi:hypothetical protein